MGNAGLITLADRPTVRSKIGGPEGSYTWWPSARTPPVDNEALCSLSHVSEKHESEQVGSGKVGGRRWLLTCPLSHMPTCERWWEVLVTLQFVASDFVLRHLIYRQAIGSLLWQIDWPASHSSEPGRRGPSFAQDYGGHPSLGSPPATLCCFRLDWPQLK